MSWKDLEIAAPELAAFGLTRYEIGGPISPRCVKTGHPASIL